MIPVTPQCSERPLSTLRAAWRDHEELMQFSTEVPDIRLGISASFTANNLVPFVGAFLLGAGFAPLIRLAPYNQVLQSCLDPRSNFGEDCNCALLLWRIEDLMTREFVAFVDGDKNAQKAALEKLNQLIQAVVQLRSKFVGTIILSAPPFPSHGPVGPFHVDGRTSAAAFHSAVAMQLRELSATTRDIHLFEWDAIQASFGISGSLDWRQWYLYQQPFSEGFLNYSAEKIGRLIVASRRPPRKCIVLDADNTLWGGVLGEDGIEGIDIGEQYPGSAFCDFQRQLLHLRNQGVILTIASKNNEEDVWKVFDEHESMVLKREHISAWAINWQPKVDAIPLIAKTLNIGIDSLVFVDDSPIEIAHMQTAYPEVACIQLPEDPAEIVPVMQNLALFDTLEITHEDRLRATLLNMEAARTALNASFLTKDEFLRTLELKVSVSRTTPEEFGRVAQLINKTNQFNLTTIRRSLDEGRTLGQSAHHDLYSVRVVDKFGDYGLTGVVVIDKRDEKNWAIDTLLLSCRVLGRRVENEVFGVLAEIARCAGVSAIHAQFLPTAKNGPASSYLADLGFTPTGNNCWRFEVSDAVSVCAQLVK